jgi:hypothetical protein
VELKLQQQQQQQQQQQGLTGDLVCTCLAHKKVEVKRGADVYTVQPGQTFQVRWGTAAADAWCC